MPAIEPNACWQSASSYNHLLKMDMAGLAWEWLRRTQHYHSIYNSQTSREQNRLVSDPIMPLRGLDSDTAALAGLHFL
jgi:Family of unknown function (DUF6499)